MPSDKTKAIKAKERSKNREAKRKDKLIRYKPRHIELEDQKKKKRIVKYQKSLKKKK